MAKTLPMFTDSRNYSYQMDLDGIVYDINIRYNYRDDYWYLGLSFPDGSAIVTGVRMVYTTDLLGRFKQPSLPKGILVLENDAGLDKMGLDDILDSELFYISEAEVNELQS